MMSAAIRALAPSLIGLVMAGAAWGADCSKDPRVAAAAEAWKAGMAPPPIAIDLGTAPCFRNALLSRLSLGPVVGYKIGVFTKQAQAVYQTNRPAVGVLQRDMLQAEGQPIPAGFAYVPLAEPDFLLVVGDEGINEAKTPGEAYSHVRGWRPFIELPDGFFPAGTPHDFALLTALDVGARRGVMGPERPLPRAEDGQAGLSALTADITIQTPQGTHRSSVKAGESLGDPLQVLLIARDLLRQEGIRFARGDLISLGTLVPAHTPVPGETFIVTYHVGDAVATIRQTFTP